MRARLFAERFSFRSVRRATPRASALVVLLALGAAFAGSSLVAAAPLMEKADLFEAGSGGYSLYRIPGIIVTAKGTVLAYCEARKGGKGDWGSIDIQLRRSTDGGKTFSAPQTISNVEGPKLKNPVALAKNLADPNEVTYNNPVAFADRDGTVHMLFCLEYMRCFAMRSADDGVTWSKPEEITATFDAFRPEYDWKVLATGPAHGIQLRTGRLVVPVWLSLGTGGHAHHPSVAATIFSDDSGRTWQRGDIAIANTPEIVDPSETVLVELADGRVMLNSRSESKRNRRLVVESADGATHWSEPRFEEALVEPVCMASMARVSLVGPQDKNRIVFINPHNLERADGKEVAGKARDRRNLSAKLSYDEGKTWPVNKSLDSGFGAYSDVAVLPDRTILCLYESGVAAGGEAKKARSYAALTLVRFNLEWLTDK